MWSRKRLSLLYIGSVNPSNENSKVQERNSEQSAGGASQPY